MARPGGLASINAFQAEDEVFVCHVPGVPVLPEAGVAQPELLGEGSGERPAEGKRRGWVLGRGEHLAPNATVTARAGARRAKAAALLWGGVRQAASRNMLNGQTRRPCDATSENSVANRGGK